MLDRFEQFSSAIASIYKMIQKIEREEAARLGLKGPHVQCLLAIRRQAQGLTINQLCDACEKDKAAISRTVAELEARELVERRGGTDRQYRLPLVLTSQGIEAADRVRRLTERAVELADDGLAETDREALYRALSCIAGNLRRISREGVDGIAKEE